jgi:hypothetical protein
MATVLLLAQLAGPACGWNYGAEITPENSPYVGCVVPSKTDPGGTRLRLEMFSPSGLRAEPARPDWLVPANP